NKLIVVQGHDHPLLMKRSLQAADTSWVAGAPPEGSAHSAKTRYRQADAPCTLSRVMESEIRVEFPTPQWAVTPGQSVVLYDGERASRNSTMTRESYNAVLSSSTSVGTLPSGLESLTGFSTGLTSTSSRSHSIFFSTSTTRTLRV